MASNYYDQTKVKSDLNITDTGNDTQLDDWSDEAEAEIDDTLYNVAAKARKISSLPILPFASGSIPQTVQGAADHLVKAKYYEYIKNTDLAAYHGGESSSKLKQYIARLAVDKVIYGRIV